MAARGDAKEATRLLRESVAVRSRLLGADHLLVAESLESLAHVALQQGDAASAVSPARSP